MNNDSKEKNYPLVSVVVVTLDRWELLKRCLQSLTEQSYPSVEIIVVDNGSKSNICEMVKTEFPMAKTIRMEKNRGFAGGNNAGFRVANGKYIALLNNDAVASPEWISTLVQVAESDEKIGAVGSLIIDGNNQAILDSFGVGLALDGMSRQRMRGMPVLLTNQIEKVIAVSGCACLIRKSALEEVGYFDEIFFAYCEDTDLCLRLLWAGWNIVVCSKARVVHYYSMTGGAYSLKKIFWVERNRIWVVLKNFPVLLLLVLPFTTLWRYIVAMRLIYSSPNVLGPFFSASGTGNVIKTIFLAYVSAIAGIPATIRHRFIFRKKHRQTSYEMLKLIMHFRMPTRKILGEN